MSYDIYCYKSRIGVPDLNEAQSIIEESESDTSQSNNSKKIEIAKALEDFNPKLERFKFDYEEIARLQSITIEQAYSDYNHIELTKAEGELAVQLTVFDNNVAVTIPYWYIGDNAKQVFNEVHEYTKIIRKTAGYFVYDPQTGKVYDPLTSDFSGLNIYIDTTIKTQNLGTHNKSTARNKPWWKFW